MSSARVFEAGVLLNPEAFWQFSCEIYQREGVKALCLYCQDELGLNVNLLLFCAWLARFNVSLTPEQWQKIKLAIASSEIELLELRKQRAAQVKGSEQYKTGLKQELRLEARQQALIIGIIEKYSLQETNEPPLHSYFAMMGCKENSTRDALLRIFSDEYKEPPR